MKKYWVTVIFICLFTGIITAQTNYELRQAMDLFKTNKMILDDSRGLLTEKDIQGSPYLDDNFVKGSVYTTSKTEYVDVPLRYNIYNDQIEFKTGDNKVLALAAPESVDKIEFGNYKIVYIPFSVAKKVRRSFFVVLAEGKASLFEKPRVTLKEATDAGAYQEAKPAEFVRNTDEYYIRVGEDLAKLVGNKKDLLEIFPDKQKQLEAFIKKQKIKPNKPESLKELVEYYNSL